MDIPCAVQHDISTDKPGISTFLCISGVEKPTQFDIPGISTDIPGISTDVPYISTDKPGISPYCIIWSSTSQANGDIHGFSPFKDFGFHTNGQGYAMWFMTFVKKGTIICSVSKT